MKKTRIYIKTILQERNDKNHKEPFVRPADMNTMCRHCVCHCPGITDASYTGCIYRKTKPGELIYEYDGDHRLVSILFLEGSKAEDLFRMFHRTVLKHPTHKLMFDDKDVQSAYQTWHKTGNIVIDLHLRYDGLVAK